MYLYKRVKTKHRDFITKTKCFYYNLDTVRKKRGVRTIKTSLSKQERNERAAYLHRKYLIYNNFDINDMWVTLTWKQDKLPDEPEQAHRILMNVLSNIRKKLARAGKPFIYFIKTEAGERQRVHHHLFIRNNFEVVSVLYDYWGEYGNVRDFRKIYSFNDGRLVTYFLDGGEHKGLNYEKYSHSRNMREPEIEKRVEHHASFRENPKPPKSDEGEEYIIQNLYNGFPDIDGYAYQEYEVVKVSNKKDSTEPLHRKAKTSPKESRKRE